MAGLIAVMVGIEEKSLREFGEKKGGRVLGNEIILDKDCLVFEMKGTKQWMYKGIILKSALEEKVMKQAVKIDENATIPSDRFDVPAGITITEILNPMNLGN